MVETLITTATVASLLVAGHTLLNALVRIIPSPADIQESVSILIPARNEEHNIKMAVTTALNQTRIPDLTVFVLDDNSTDNTLEILQSLHDPRLHVITSCEEPPSGWLGKAWACQRLSAQTQADILVFIDADVQLHPDAVCSAVASLRKHDLELVSPFPRQLTSGGLSRLIQPLLSWSWLASVPLYIARRFTIPMLAVANGQFIVCTRHAYQQVGGHEAVKDCVIEDIELARAFSRKKFRGSVTDGSNLASCLMYRNNRELINGYSKNAWAAFHGVLGSIAVNSAMALVFLMPIAGLFTGHVVESATALSATTLSRFVAARITHSRTWPEILLHPVAVVAFIALNVVSWFRHCTGTNLWKGRNV